MIELILVAQTLELRLNQGDSFDQRAVYRYVDAEDDLTMEFRYRRVATVLQTGSQFTVEVAEWQIDTLMDGESVQSAPDQKPRKLKRDLLPDGTLAFVQRAPIDPTEYERLARTLSVVLPRRDVKPGDAWTHTYPTGKLAGAKGVYRLVASGRVSFDYRETSDKLPMTATGEATLDPRTGWPLRLQADVGNVKIPGGDGRPVRLRVEIGPSP